MKKSKIKQPFYFWLSRKKQVQKVDQMMQKFKYKDAEKVTCYIDPYRRIMDRDWFDEQVLLKFEDTEFFVPQKYENVLSELYGDWRRLPPVENSYRTMLSIHIGDKFIGMIINNHRKKDKI